jgi:branched-chain amino acid transport system ATP-binding protein
VLRVEGVSVSYGGIKALREVSLTVEKGQLVSVIGANGAGKTTLMRAIMGLVKPEGGRIFLKDKEVAAQPAWKRAMEGLSIVPEGGRTFPYLTVLANLMMGAYTVKDKHIVEKNLSRTYSLFPVLK